MIFRIKFFSIFFFNQKELGKFLHPLHCWCVFLAPRCWYSLLFRRPKSEMC